MRRVHEVFHAGVDGRHHGLRAHGVDLHARARLLRFVEQHAQVLHFLRRGTGLRRQRDLADPFHAELRDRLSFRADFVRRAVREIEARRRNDARAADHAFIDVVAQRDVAFGRAAARQDRRVACVEQRLHFLLLVRARVHVTVRVDEAGQGAHAVRVDRLGRVRRGGADRRDLAAADQDRAPFDDGAVADDDAHIIDGEILCAQRAPGRKRTRAARKRERRPDVSCFPR